MQLNLSRMSLPAYKAYALAVKLGLPMSRKELDVNIAFYALLNHGSPIGVVLIRPLCRHYKLNVTLYVQHIFSDRILTEDIARLLFSKFRPVAVTINGVSIANRLFRPARCKQSKHNWDVSAVGALFVDDEKNCLVVYRCDYCKWSIPTGTIEEGEQPIQTLKREMQEELGVTIKVAQRLFVVTTPKNNLLFVYKVKWNNWSQLVNKDINVQPVFNLVHINHLTHLKSRTFVLDKVISLLT